MSTGAVSGLGCVIVLAFLIIDFVVDLRGLRNWSFLQIEQIAYRGLGRVVVVHLTLIFGLLGGRRDRSVLCTVRRLRRPQDAVCAGFGAASVGAGHTARWFSRIDESPAECAPRQKVRGLLGQETAPTKPIAATETNSRGRRRKRKGGKRFGPIVQPMTSEYVRVHGDCNDPTDTSRADRISHRVRAGSGQPMGTDRSSATPWPTRSSARSTTISRAWVCRPASCVRRRCAPRCSTTGCARS